jgi:hypothetical protein
LQQEVGHGDRARLEQYFDDVREIERRLEIAAEASTETPNVPVPYGVPASFDEHIKLQLDLLSLAFQADITRVGTLLYARDRKARGQPASGLPAEECAHGQPAAQHPRPVRYRAGALRRQHGTAAGSGLMS